MSLPSPLPLLRRLMPLPPATIPGGRIVELPGRGSTYVTDVPGPEGAPTVVLLHAVACTGLLTWYPALEPLSRRYRVVTFDQRWHGRGICSERFSLADCADDVAALVDALDLGPVLVVGYSMGSVIAQRVWRQHPTLVAGLVLCASTDRFRSTPAERVFHQGVELATGALRGVSASRAARTAGRAATGTADGSDIDLWALEQLRSTSAWAVAQALAALGRHHSRPWLRQVDVPAAVVVTRRDRVIPAARQRALARRIPATTTHEVDAGHAACVLQHAAFVPALLEALAVTSARVADRAG